MRRGAGRYQREYFERMMGRAALVDGPVEKVIEAMVDRGAWIIATADGCAADTKRLAEQSGGFGGFMVQTIDWAPRDRMLHSYELLARYVMPQLQRTAPGTAAANAWAYDRCELLKARCTRAVARARKDYAQRQA